MNNLPLKDSRLRLPELLMLLATLTAPFLMVHVKAITLYDGFVFLAFVALLARGKEIRFLEGKLLFPLLVLSVLVLVATFRAPKPVESLFSLAQILFIFLIQMPAMCTILNNKRQQLLNFRAFVFSVVAIVIWGCIHIAMSGGTALARLEFPYTNPNHLGFVLAIGGPFFLAWLTQGEKKARRAWKWAVLLGAFVLLALTGSRSSWLAFFLSTSMYLALITASKHNLRHIIRTALKYGLILAGVLIAVYLLFPSSIIQSRVQMSLDWDSPLIQNRVTGIIAALGALDDYALVGIGLDNFQYVIGAYTPAQLSFKLTRKTHNTYLLYCVQTGFFGMVTFVLLLGLFYKRMFMGLRLIAKRDIQYQLMAACLSSFSSVVVISMFITQITRRLFWLPYGFGLAIVYSVLSPKRSEASDRDNREG